MQRKSGLTSQRSLESKAHRIARRFGLVARKSRRGISIDNLGDFSLIDPGHNCIVAGSRYDLTAEEIISYCSKL
jgi:hypothetical protein